MMLRAWRRSYENYCATENEEAIFRADPADLIWADDYNDLIAHIDVADDEIAFPSGPNHVQICKLKQKCVPHFRSAEGLSVSRFFSACGVKRGKSGITLFAHFDQKPKWDELSKAFKFSQFSFSCGPHPSLCRVQFYYGGFSSSTLSSDVLRTDDFRFLLREVRAAAGIENFVLKVNNWAEAIRAYRVCAVFAAASGADFVHLQQHRAAIELWPVLRERLLGRNVRYLSSDGKRRSASKIENVAKKDVEWLVEFFDELYDLRDLWKRRRKSKRVNLRPFVATIS